MCVSTDYPHFDSNFPHVSENLLEERAARDRRPDPRRRRASLRLHRRRLPEGGRRGGREVGACADGRGEAGPRGRGSRQEVERGQRHEVRADRRDVLVPGRTDSTVPNNDERATMNWYLDVLRKYAVFRERARRREYWVFFLVSTIIFVGLSIIDVATGTFSPAVGIGLLGGLYSLATLIPGIAVTVRHRRHGASASRHRSQRLVAAHRGDSGDRRSGPVHLPRSGQPAGREPVRPEPEAGDGLERR